MERYIKANRKVVEFLQLTEDRTELPDGNFILWCQDILPLVNSIILRKRCPILALSPWMARQPVRSRTAKCATSCLLL